MFTNMASVQETPAQRLRRFAAEHSSLLLVAGLFLFLFGVLCAYKAYTSDKRLSVRSSEVTDFDSKNAADDLAARQRAAVSSEQDAAAGEPQTRMAVIPDKDMVGLSGPDKTPEQLLRQLASGPEEEYTSVSLSNKDLEYKIMPVQAQGPNLSVSATAIEEIDEHNKSVKLSAPVTHYAFRDAASYGEFRRLHPSGGLPQQVDFGKNCVVVLVSASSLPNKVFEAVSSETAAGQAVVKYRLNPLAASEPGPDRYAFALLDASITGVVLEQQ